jgi:hypothetical protein
VIDRHASKIVGVLSCFDRVVMQGTIPNVCHAGAVATLLDSQTFASLTTGRSSLAARQISDASDAMERQQVKCSQPE